MARDLNNDLTKNKNKKFKTFLIKLKLCVTDSVYAYLQDKQIYIVLKAPTQGRVKGTKFLAALPLKILQRGRFKPMSFSWLNGETLPLCKRLPVFDNRTKRGITYSIPECPLQQKIQLFLLEFFVGFLYLRP